MKPCPWCAEQIQDAATVCKHCGRRLKKSGAGTVFAWLGSTVLGAFLIFVTAIYFSEDHQAFIVFDKKRTEWRQRCDRFVKQPVLDAEGQRCKDELAALSAEAKRRGWDR